MTCILSDDTDVFVLLLYWVNWADLQCKVHMERWDGSVKYFTDRSKAVLLLWIFYVFVLSCVCYLYVLCGHLLGKG